MARPKKLTLDFFVHSATISRDCKPLRRLELRHKCEGYSTYFKLLELLCQEDGMKLDLSRVEDLEILAVDFYLRDVQHLTVILQDCANVGLLDKQLWESERIAFSPDLYEKYLERLEDRRQAAIRKNNQKEASNLRSRIAALQKNDVFPELPEVITQENPVITRDKHPDITDITDKKENQDLYAVNQAKMSRDDTVITQEKPLTKVESEEVAPTSEDLASSASAPEEVKKTKRSRPRKEKPVGLTAEDLNRVVEVYNANKPGCWSSVEILGTDRQRVLAKWLKDLGSIDGVIEAIEKALKSANDDDFWSGRSGKAHRLNFETLNDKGHLLTWAEAWNAAHPAKNQIQVVKNYPAGVTVENYQAWDELQVLAQRLGHKIEVLASREVFLIDGKTCHYGLLRMQLDDWRQKSLRKTA